MIGLFFDTETTGVKSWKDPGFIPRLVQLGAILQDLESRRVLAEINIMVEPEGVEIPAGAAAVHGITTDMAKQFGTDLNFVDSMFATLVTMADIIVAHNSAYDMEVVADNLSASKLLIGDKPVFCTMKASTNVVKAPFSEKQLAFFKDRPDKKDGDYKSPNLTETYQHFFGEKFEGAHDAMADIRACRDIFFELDKLGLVIKSVEEPF